MTIQASELLQDDYLNEVYGVRQFVEFSKRTGIPIPKELRIKKFWERYSVSSKQGRRWFELGIEVTDDDKRRIAELDNIADIVNSELNSNPINAKKLAELTEKAKELCRYSS